jgi:hypothetical protein
VLTAYTIDRYIKALVFDSICDRDIVGVDEGSIPRPPSSGPCMNKRKRKIGLSSLGHCNCS